MIGQRLLWEADGGVEVNPSRQQDRQEDQVWTCVRLGHKQGIDYKGSEEMNRLGAESLPPFLEGVRREWPLWLWVLVASR